ncbi:putative lipid II flippase FtsW [Candidatus Margulisiibacteriota bacterium]
MPKQRVDYIFLFSVLTLSAIGLIMIFSASPTMAMKLGDSYFYLKRHVFYLLLGFAALYFGVRLDLDILKKWAGPILALSVLVLLLVYIPGIGRRVSGALRWIDLVIFSFQPSELIKFTMVLYLAKMLAGAKDNLGDFFRGLLPALTLVGLVCAIIIAQPDLGTALAIAMTSFIMLFAAGADLWHLGLLAVLGIAGAFGLSVNTPYRMNRLVAFLNPWKDPQGAGFHIVQSLLAIGSGGLLGQGLGASRQKFFYLPQQFTDFIFAILCEELGFVGGAGVIFLFVLFAVRGFRIAITAQDDFSSLLATGLVSWITLQAVINIMVVIGMLPTTGIPLPFISYGGTATIMSLFSAGILLNISLQPAAAAKK